MVASNDGFAKTGGVDEFEDETWDDDADTSFETEIGRTGVL
jgi:hypothetical protein